MGHRLVNHFLWLNILIAKFYNYTAGVTFLNLFFLRFTSDCLLNNATVISLILDAVLIFFYYHCFYQMQNFFFSCGLREERGFLTWHFIIYFLVILLSVVIIAVIYLTMWINVSRQTTIISTTLKQASAVNTKRLALRLSLYIVVNVIQFGGSVVEGLWISFGEPPLVVRYVHMFAGVAAGTLNGIVYLTVRRE